MAENLVSKFTINSQGTDIDVKIKDEDARNLIAQEISDRDSAVTTITNNLNKEISDRESADTTIINNLNKEISDRESADTTITNKLNKEISDRESADATITNKLNTKKQIVVIGDSFSSTAQSVGPLWYTYIAKKYNADVITHASDGKGFMVGGDNDFNHQIDKCAAEADIDNVMTVYIYGGLNDLTQFTSDSSGVHTVFRQAVMNVISNAQLKFPNSEIILVGINTFQQYNFTSPGSYGKDNAMFEMDIEMNYVALKSKIKFIDITNQTLYTPDFYGVANGAGQKHPSAFGEAYIANLILGGSPYKYDIRDKPPLIGTNCTLSNLGAETRINEIWVHGTMVPSTEGAPVISFRGYTPPRSPYVLFVCEASRKATYGIVDVSKEYIVLYSFDQEEYYFEFPLS